MRLFFTILPLVLLMAPLAVSAWLLHLSEKKERRKQAHSEGKP
jgi:uncharacterized protein involved in cysteine biosynthesis